MTFYASGISYGADNLSSVYYGDLLIPKAYRGSDLVFGSEDTTISPSDIAGLQFWLDADDSNTITLNGGTVSQWDDKSGNDYHVTQATASNQPTYTSSALNGRSVIAFDGANDLLRNATATPVSGSGSRTMLIVYNVTGGSGNGIVNLGYTVGSTARQFVCSREIAIRCINVVRRFTESNDGTTYMIVTYMLDGTTGNDLSAFKNGSALSVLSTTGGATTLDTAAGIELTNDGNSGANIAEILVYSSALSTSDRQNVESYLSSKWGITLS